MNGFKLIRGLAFAVIVFAVFLTDRPLKAEWVECELGTGNPTIKGAFMKGAAVTCDEMYTYAVCDYACFECYGGTVFDDGIIACLPGVVVACDCDAIEPENR